LRPSRPAIRSRSASEAIHADQDLQRPHPQGRLRHRRRRQLDLHWDNQSITAYKQVPQEVYRRLCSAPNPATYWEDRIAEEYPKATPMTNRDGPPGGKSLRRPVRRSGLTGQTGPALL
jgi:hypothetical protein